MDMDRSFGSLDADSFLPDRRGMASSARNVQNTLSSLSDSPRSTRYGQFDRDRSFSWDDPNPRSKSIRDAGLKDRPASVLGSIASSSKRPIKEIERYVYEEEDTRGPSVGRSMRRRGSPIGEFGGYERRSYDYDSPRSPSRRSYDEDNFLDDEYYESDDRYSPRDRRPRRRSMDRGIDDRFVGEGEFDDPMYDARERVPNDRRWREEQYDDEYEYYDEPRSRRPRKRRRREEYFEDAPRERYSRGEYYDDSPRRRPMRDMRDDYDDGPRNPSWGDRPFGVNRRNIGYQDMNGSYYTRNRRPTIGDFDRPAPSRRGHVGQSLIDYQVRPPRRERRRGNDIIDVDSRTVDPYDDYLDDY